MPFGVVLFSIVLFACAPAKLEEPASKVEKIEEKKKEKVCRVRFNLSDKKSICVYEE